MVDRQDGARSVKAPSFLPSHVVCVTSAFFDSKGCWTMHMSSSCHELISTWNWNLGGQRGALDQPSDHNSLDVIAFGIMSCSSSLHWSLAWPWSMWAGRGVGPRPPCAHYPQLAWLFSRVEPGPKMQDQISFGVAWHGHVGAVAL